MRRLTLIAGSLPALDLASAGATMPSRAGGLFRVEQHGFAFGTTVRVVVVHSDRRQALAAADAALVEISAIDALLSVQSPGSQVALLNAQGRLDDADPRMIEALQAALRWSRDSDGAFDVSVQPLWLAFEAARRAGRLPSDQQVREALSRVGPQGIAINARSVALQRDGAALTLNGLSQGYAADRALAVLRDHRVDGALVDSGEFRALGTDQRQQRWRLGVRHPRSHEQLLATLTLRDRAVSTSGDYEYSFTPDRLNHHIFDPRTGYSPRQWSSVTVVAPAATDADALSTALMVLDPQAGQQLVEQLPGTSALFVDKAGVLTTAGSEIASILR